MYIDIEKIKEHYHFTINLIEEKIKEMVEEFGANGLELNTHLENDCFSVTEEIEPNNFVVITKVRVNEWNDLEVMVVGETEWSCVMSITDWVFFLDEVYYAVEREYENMAR